ncbi:MAG: lactonase family protein, partial [Candidatus Tectomicrobia bacterium]|nr:lactonase family protein [Candidatus Tectomicrobia bacterium]
MPYYMYIALQDDDRIGVFTIDAETGHLTPKTEAPISGGPSLLAISPNRQVLYVGHRAIPGISSFRIDPVTGGLTQNGTVSPE